MSNENRKSGSYDLSWGGKSVKIYYEAYPDKVNLDDDAWIGRVSRPLDRVLLNMGITRHHVEEMVAESVGY